MPIPWEIEEELNNCVAASGGSNAWRMDFYTTDNIHLGYFLNGTGYTQDATLNTAKNVKLYVDSAYAIYDGTDSTVLTITALSGAITCRPQSNLALDTWYYLDSNGVLYTDEALTTPFHDQNVDTDTLELGEDEEIEASGETLDSIVFSETNSVDDPAGETVDTLTFSEENETEDNVNFVDTIVLSEEIRKIEGDSWTEVSVSSSSWTERRGQ